MAELTIITKLPLPKSSWKQLLSRYLIAKQEVDTFKTAPIRRWQNNSLQWLERREGHLPGLLR